MTGLSTGLPVHQSMAFFTINSYDFCWTVGALNHPEEDGQMRCRSLAMAARSAYAIPTIRVWITTPSGLAGRGHHRTSETER
jgi:hypothetical protein